REYSSAHRLETALCESDQAHAVVNPSWSEASLCDLKATALTEQQIRCRHAHVFERNLRMPMGRIVVPENRHHPADRNTRRVHRHQDHRLLLVSGSLRIGLPHEDGNAAAWITRAGNEPLASVDHIVVAVAHDARTDVRGI